MDNKKLVLIIEDEEKLAWLLRDKLAAEGFDAQVAVDGKEAIDFCEKQNPDLILLDLLLPKIGGIDVLKHIRQSENLKDVPVLIVTNLTDDNIMKESRKLGVVDYLVKSNVKLSGIIDIVKNYLKD